MSFYADISAPWLFAILFIVIGYLCQLSTPADPGKGFALSWFVGLIVLFALWIGTFSEEVSPGAWESALCAWGVYGLVFPCLMIWYDRLDKHRRESPSMGYEGV